MCVQEENDQHYYHHRHFLMSTLTTEEEEEDGGEEDKEEDTERTSCSDIRSRCCCSRCSRRQCRRRRYRRKLLQLASNFVGKVSFFLVLAAFTIHHHDHHHHHRRRCCYYFYVIANLFHSTFSSLLLQPFPSNPISAIQVSAFSATRSNTYHYYQHQHHHQKFHLQRSTVLSQDPPTRYSSPSISSSSSTTTSICLFFQNPIDEEEGLVDKNTSIDSAIQLQQQPRRPIISKETKLGLRSPDISFPFYIQWEKEEEENDDDDYATTATTANDDDDDDDNDANDNDGQLTTITTKSSTEEGKLYIRLMTPNDLDGQIIPMCIDEFGTGPTTKLQDFPLLQKLRSVFNDRESYYYGGLKNDEIFLGQQPFSTPTSSSSSLSSQISSWWDRFWLEPFVKWALTAKMLTSGNSGGHQSQHGGLSDPALLVLCERRKRLAPKSIFKNNKRKEVEVDNKTKADEAGDEEEVIVGMVEISLQPIEYDKNPPAFPVPRWIKEQYSQIKDLGPLEGWVTNLLVSPTARGKSYSKFLMWATEGIAKKWNCHSIYLHADADIQSGRVPQRLYEGLGYRVVHGNPKTFRAFQQSQRRQRQTSSSSSSSSPPSLSTNYNAGGDDDIFAWAADASRIAGLSPFSSSIRMVQGAALLCYSKKMVDTDEENNDYNSW